MRLVQMLAASRYGRPRASPGGPPEAAAGADQVEQDVGGQVAPHDVAGVGAELPEQAEHRPLIRRASPSRQTTWRPRKGLSLKDPQRL